jgi:ubiquinone/menaquinone biosynthesis C-methylase UbiE
MMNLYEKHILPSIINLGCGVKPIRKQREKVVPHAEGRVLEVGMGSGLNAPFYDRSKVKIVLGLEPNLKAQNSAKEKLENVALPHDFIGLDGQEIPLEDNSVDTVVLTYTLCTIPEAVTATKEMRRVLKPGGKLLFSEHGKAPVAAVAKWQDRVNPLWGKLFGGCHLNRDIPNLLRRGGFEIEQLSEGFIPGPKIACYTYWGSAN